MTVRADGQQKAQALRITVSTILLGKKIDCDKML